MAEVRIRRCRVLVKRRGGWSWGPDPRALVKALLAVLPRLLERRLGPRWREDEEVWIAAPVHIRIPVRWSEFAPQRRRGESQEAWEAAVEIALAPHLERTLAAAFGDPHPTEGPGRAEESPAFGVAEAPPPRGSEFEAMLAGWLQAGSLGYVLERLPRATLESWHRRLMERCRWGADVHPSEPGPAGSLEPPANEWQRVREALGEYPRPAPARMRYELAFAAELAARRRVGFDDPLVRQALLALRAAAGEPTPERGRGAETAIEAAEPRAPVDSGRSIPVETVRPAATVRTADVRFACALPWLALAALTRAGVVQALGGIFEAEHRESLLPLFGAAFGAKLYATPEPAWKHAEAARRAIAAFGGIEAAGLERLADLPRAAEPALAPAWLAFHAAVRAGRNAAAPIAMLTDETRRFWLLMDMDEGCPLGWAAAIEGLVPSLSLYPASPVWFVPGGLRRAELDLLAQTGATLLPGLPAEREERLLSVWRYFEDGHVAIPRAPSRDLERLLTALACLALAALSARLPQKDRRADPREVFEAFADLDALAEFRGERIRIRLPLGQRYFALEKAGLLHPFPGAAWLAGRTVEFSRG